MLGGQEPDSMDKQVVVIRLGRPRSQSALTTCVVGPHPYCAARQVTNQSAQANYNSQQLLSHDLVVRPVVKGGQERSRRLPIRKPSLSVTQGACPGTKQDSRDPGRFATGIAE